MLKPQILRQFMLLSAFTLVASTKAMVAVDAQAQSHMRSLSAAEDTRTDRFEERGFNAIPAKAALQLEKFSPSLRFRLSLDKEKLISTFFKESNVKTAKGNLFAREQYQMWASRVFRAYKNRTKAYKALFRELKQQFDDYELASLILEGLASSRTEAVAKHYYDLQIQDWIANKENVDVFRALKLDIDKGSVFKNPLLETYVSFARQLPRKDGSGDQIVFDRLYRLLKEKYGVPRLAKMLGASNVDLREGSIGKRVMDTMQHKVFVGWSEISLLSFLKKAGAEDAAATSTWLSLIKGSFGTTRYKQLVNDLSEGLWKERDVKEKALATVLTVAQKDESTRISATYQLEKLFRLWDEENKTASDVLDILGLKVAGMKAEDIVESPLLETWFAFESRQRFDDAKLLETLLRHLTMEQLASMTVLETKDSNMAARFLDVRKALFEKWQMEALDEDAVFQRLHLHIAGDKLFTHPALDAWYWYVVECHGTDPGAFILRVVKKYYRNSESLFDMVHKELGKEGFSGAISVAEALKE